MHMTNLRIAVLCCWGVVAFGHELTRESGFADKLFQGSMKYANQSLNGRFIREMVAGTLPRAVFERYLYQDNLYLSKYARAFAVLGARAKETDELAWLLNYSVASLHEHGAQYNTDLDEATFERDASQIAVAYTSFFLQAVWGESPIIGYAAVLPCQRLYDWLFATVNATEHIADDNPYKDIIRQYADPKNHATSIQLEAFLDRYAAQGAPEEVTARAQYTYNQAMRYEAQFFDQGFHEPSDNEQVDVADAQQSERALSDVLLSGRAHHGKILLDSQVKNADVQLRATTPAPVACFALGGVMTAAMLLGVLGLRTYGRSLLSSKELKDRSEAAPFLPIGSGA